MCQDNSCNKKEACLRFKGEPNPYQQSYFLETPFKNNDCEFYYEIKENTPLTEKEEMNQFIITMQGFIDDYSKNNNFIKH